MRECSAPVWTLGWFFLLLGALAAQQIGWRHSMRDRCARRRTKIRRLAYRLGLAENKCAGKLPVASDFLVPLCTVPSYEQFALAGVAASSVKGKT